MKLPKDVSGIRLEWKKVKTKRGEKSVHGANLIQHVPFGVPDELLNGPGRDDEIRTFMVIACHEHVRFAYETIERLLGEFNDQAMRSRVTWARPDKRWRNILAAVAKNRQRLVETGKW